MSENEKICPTCKGTGLVIAATDIQRREVGWYHRFGKYPNERIRKDGNGNEYVIGDWSWSRNYPDKDETIEIRLKSQI